MEEKRIISKGQNNKVTISGTVVSDLELDHELCSEKFYKFYLSSKRFSEKEDIIPIVVSERLPEFKEIKKGKKIFVKGQYHSYNQKIQEKSRLILIVLALEIELKEDNDFPYYDINKIILQGYICKRVNCRKTTATATDIADIILAVNYPNKESDYIPCIAWWENAVFAGSFEVGKEILIKGRIQSRKYFKKISENEFEERTAYEVSISQIEEIQEIEDVEKIS